MVVDPLPYPGENRDVSTCKVCFIPKLQKMYPKGVSPLCDIISRCPRVTSQFIVNGVLDQLSMLTKLNLSRTAVCDIGNKYTNTCACKGVYWTLSTIFAVHTKTRGELKVKSVQIN